MHLTTGGVNPKQGYIEYKVLLNNVLATYVDIFGVNERNLDTTNLAIERNLLDIGEKIIKMGKRLKKHQENNFQKHINRWEPSLVYQV